MKKLFLFILQLLPIFINAQIQKIRAVYITNPAYNINIQWSDTKNRQYTLYYDTDADFKDKKLDKKITPQKINKYKGLYNYFVDLQDLKPNTKYFFQIVSKQDTSEIYWFKTLSEQKDKISVIAGGDSRTNRNIRQKANLMVSKLQPDFVIFDGDFTECATRWQWKQWLEDWQLTIAPNNHIIPIVIVQGNHEEYEDIQRIFNIPHYAYYDLIIGKNFIQIFSLNTEEPIGGQQTNWFVDELKKSKAYWKIVAYHRPMRPHHRAKKEGYAQIRNWAYPIYQYGVQLVIEGDTHTAKWTYPIKPDTTAPLEYESFIRDDQNGTVYIGEGTWGAPLRKADDIKPWTRDAQAINQFKWLWIDNDKIEIRTVLYENASSVGQLDYNNRFQLPENINLWQPKNGSLLTIKHK